MDRSAFPDAEAVRGVLTLAVQAPSVYNSQPWIWKVDEDSLRLHADPTKFLRHDDPDCRDLLISCGASLHHCTIALASLGWRATIRRLPDPADPSLLAVLTVQPQPPDDLALTLAAAIRHRRADRREYSPTPVPWGDIALMGARAARAGVMLRQIDDWPQLRKAVAESAVEGRGEGNGLLVALGTESDDVLSRLRAGEAASLVLLSATAKGLSTCPVTEPLQRPDIHQTVRDDVFGASGYPQMLLRIGWPAVGAEPLPATPRRPLEEVTDWKFDGAVSGRN